MKTCDMDKKRWEEQERTKHHRDLSSAAVWEVGRKVCRQWQRKNDGTDQWTVTAAGLTLRAYSSARNFPDTAVPGSGLKASKSGVTNPDLPNERLPDSLSRPWMRSLILCVRVFKEWLESLFLRAITTTSSSDGPECKFEFQQRHQDLQSCHSLYLPAPPYLDLYQILSPFDDGFARKYT